MKRILPLFYITILNGCRTQVLKRYTKTNLLRKYNMKKALLLLEVKHPLAIHEVQNQRFTTENENGEKPSILILRLGEEGRLTMVR